MRPDLRSMGAAFREGMGDPASAYPAAAVAGWVCAHVVRGALIGVGVGIAIRFVLG